MANMTKAQAEKLYPNGKIDIDPKNFYSCEIFPLPLDLRNAAVEHMYKMSSVKWVCTGDFLVTKPVRAGWTFKHEFKKGTEYTGIPYAQTRATLEEWKEFTKNGFTTDKSDWWEVPGVECVQSIQNALQLFNPVHSYSGAFCPANKDCIAIKVGDYECEIGEYTKEIVMNNGREKMFECYALLLHGDVVQTYGELNHSRMVAKDAVVVRDSDGNIDGDESYIICIEQTDHFDKMRTDVKTTWYVEHQYTFNRLFDSFFLPMSFEQYKDNSANIPYLALDMLPDKEKLQKGEITGNIISDYPIRFVTFTIKDKDGNTVKEYTKRNSNSPYFVFPLGKFQDRVFDGVEKGSYSLSVKAGLESGSAVLCECEFDYNK